MPYILMYALAPEMFCIYLCIATFGPMALYAWIKNYNLNYKIIRWTTYKPRCQLFCWRHSHEESGTYNTCFHIPDVILYSAVIMSEPSWVASNKLKENRISSRIYSKICPADRLESETDCSSRPLQVGPQQIHFLYILIGQEDQLLN
jgi:hypothetical protein